MSTSAITVSGVYKIFQIFERPHDRLRQAVGARVSRLAGKSPRKYCREFAALSDVSFMVERGDTVGIIGENGSGKSTLLQIICGTLAPTAGSVAVDGRVAALLELGAGFNPEFTGRENVYMSAAILGLTREQVDARYADIVAFADIGDFLEQPVKLYSSGMYVRLAFAVIAHVDADVLIVDEALAVGDAIFVQKCMRFLRAFREKGTLLFVSHDAASITNFCQRVIWLDHGRVRMEGEAKKVMDSYAEYCARKMYGDSIAIAKLGSEAVVDSTAVPVEEESTNDVRVDIFSNIENSEGWQSGHAAILEVRLETRQGQALASFCGGEKVVLRIVAETHEDLASPILGFFVKDRLGQSLFGEHTFTHVQPPLHVRAGERIEARFTFVLPLLPNGDYSMTVSIAEGDPYTHVQHHWLHDAVLIKVSSPTLRYGLVGIPFEKVVMDRVEKDAFE